MDALETWMTLTGGEPAVSATYGVFDRKIFRAAARGAQKIDKGHLHFSWPAPLWGTQNGNAATQPPYLS